VLAVAAVVAVLALVAGTAFVLTRDRGDNAGAPPGTGAPDPSGATGATAGPGCHAVDAAPAADDAAAAKSGGTLRVGLSDESEGFDPTRSGLNASGLIVASTIFDPLAQITDDGQVQPYLATAIDHNPDSTSFAISLPANVTFHDGTKLDANAVKANIEASRTNKVVGPAYAPIDQVRVDDPQHLTITMKTSWPAFPVLLSGQLGMIESPAVLGTDAGAKKPVGTGPYEYKDWRPGQVLTVTKNPSYWRASPTAGPFLDTIEFHPITDDFSRIAALHAGNLDVAMATDSDAITKLRSSGPAPAELASMNYVVLNTTKAPFNDPRARRAVALATDTASLVAGFHSDLVQPLASPFPADSRWCVADSGATGYDLAAAHDLAAAYQKDTGKPLSFKLSLASSPGAPQLGKALVDMWAKAGIQATLGPSDRTNFLLSVLAGGYQAGLQNQRPVQDPDSLYDWVHTPPSGLAPNDPTLNLSRISDPALDKAVEISRRTSNPADRQQVVSEIVRLINKDVPYVWLYATSQTIAGSGKVHGISSLESPSRPTPRPWASGVWVDQSS
jgi:ABC-type transport system substrate-binding protein